MCEKVNGWTNYETWNFNLWYGDSFQEQIDEIKESDDEPELKHDIAYTLIEEFIEELKESSNLDNGFMLDIITASIQQVNITELVNNYLAD